MILYIYNMNIFWKKTDGFLVIKKIFPENIQITIFNFLYLKCWLGKECDIPDCKYIH
jgi:hypothetical protein